MDCILEKSESDFIYINDGWISGDSVSIDRYGEELNRQNEFFAKEHIVFRYIEPELEKDSIILNESTIDTIEKDIIRTINTSEAEDLFEDIFAEAIGFGYREYLNFQYPIRYNSDNIIFVDYFLRCSKGLIVFEINGETFHNPLIVGRSSYIKQIKRQNYIVSKGIKVFRWTMRQLKENREKIIKFLKDYLSDTEFFRSDDLYEKNKVHFVENWKHQDDAISTLVKIRENSEKAALITQATGTGKTVIAVKDSKIVNGRTLFLAHTVELVQQAKKKYTEFWSEGVVDGKVECLTVQTMLNRIHSYERDYFDYIAIDEAHHGAARTYRYIIEYFEPKFLLGLTATPERMDRQNLEEIFGKIAHSLDLETAIVRGKLAPVRAIRVNTNISFEKIKVSRFDYTKKDLEKKLFVKKRDEIILNTYNKFIKGTNKKTVIFCVSVEHAKRLANLFKDNSIRAEAIHGSMKFDERQKYLEQYQNGNIEVLTSCSVLSEGWDSPVTSVLFMARPTMSKVLYTQQLGRGLRKYPGKDYLLVVDFVDNFMASDPSWSIHALFNKTKYRLGDFVCVPADLQNLKIQPDFIQNLDINLWIKSFEEIDPFTFEQKTNNMISSAELARELWVSDGMVNSNIRKGKIQPDKSFDFGNRKLYFFLKTKIDSIRDSLGLKKRDLATIKEDLFEFIEKRDYTFSFKIVFLRYFLSHLNDKGIANIEALLNSYMSFYLMLYREGIQVEANSSPYNKYDYITNKSNMKDSMLSNPFEKFERKRFMNYCEDLSEISFHNFLWEKLDRQDMEKIVNQLVQDLQDYYRKRLKIDLPDKILKIFRDA